jgi:hypothetical protein
VCKLWVSEFKQFTVFQDLIGFNLYGMQFMQREIETVEGVQLFRDATVEKKKGRQEEETTPEIKKVNDRFEQLVAEYYFTSCARCNLKFGVYFGL